MADGSDWMMRQNGASMTYSQAVEGNGVCRVRVESVEEGLVPSEKVVRIQTADGGQEEVAVSDRAVQNGALEAAYISTTDGKVLIELPRESASGRRRVWVDQRALVGR